MALEVIRVPSDGEQPGTERHGWFARQRARLGGILMGAGASIHPFENERALGILQDAFDDERCDVDTESEQ